MIRVILIDDEPLARLVVKEYLQSFSDVSVVAECNDGFEGVKAVAQHKPELIFLDIQMPKINGFEMMELLDPAPAVIFTTAFDEYAIKAFEAHAVDYLLKPFSKERFDKAMQKWMAARHGGTASAAVAAAVEDSQQPEEKTRVVVKKGSNIVILPVQTIHYFEAFDDYVKIHTKDGFFLKKKTMSYFERTMDASLFVRVHRSFMINVQELTRIEPLEKENYIALLKSGARVPISQAGYTKLKDVLGI